MSSPGLYPATAPRREWQLAVDGGHRLHVREYGRADGIPALVLHGGPGSGCSPLQPRFFDPARYRVICPDQRGAGLSQPRGGSEHNTTADLIADLLRLREHMRLEDWLVVGGSWGATLAVAYAAAEPEAVRALLLRSSFIGRRADVTAFFEGAAGQRPRAWQRLRGFVPEGRDALQALADALHGPDPALRERAAQAFWCWEQALVAGDEDRAPPLGEALAFQVDRLRVQTHYLLHDCWLTAPPLLERCAALPRVPTLLLHARDDLVCPAAGALELHARLPHARLQWTEQGGHDPSQPQMAAAMVAALDRYAADGRFAAEAPP
ncbi:MAG: alpha/beta fold hydrolase [Burkholderiales bacterium]|nr:alpha/beta fold hydrolase [Burkholderiales bacterium]MDE2456523.1 alpha/beta fold hydrolase [Burkholderiales bacterium]